MRYTPPVLNARLIDRYEVPFLQRWNGVFIVGKHVFYFKSTVLHRVTHTGYTVFAEIKRRF